MVGSRPAVDQLAGSKALVVGGAGFVGSNLTLRLLESGASHITVVDNLLSSDADNLVEDERVTFIFGSIADPRVLNQLNDDLDYIFQLACYHGNQSSIANPMADLDNNLLPSLVLFDHLARRDLPKKVVYAAAGCAVAAKTYGETAATVEDSPISLLQDSPYSISKLAGELYGNYYWRSSGLPFVRARFQNVYGPREVLGAGQWRGTPETVWRNVIPTFVWRALKNEPLRLDNAGKTSRDFIYVEDICDGLIACALFGEPGEAYNLASGVETTIGTVARIILEETHSSSQILMAPKRPWDASGRRFGDPAKSRSQLGFSAAVSIDEGLKRTIQWTRDNEPRINAAMARHERFMRRYDPSGIS